MKVFFFQKYRVIESFEVKEAKRAKKEKKIERTVYDGDMGPTGSNQKIALKLSHIQIHCFPFFFFFVHFWQNKRV